MSLKLTYFLKLFIASGLSFAILGSVMEFMFTDVLFSLPKALFKGLFFGLFMALFLTPYHFYELKHLGITNVTQADLKPKQVRYIPSSLSFTAVIDLIKSHAFNFTFLRNDDNTIYLKKKLSSKSWGEDITIQISDQGYVVTSKPKFFQWADMGSGIANVIALQKIITDASPTKSS